MKYLVILVLSIAVGVTNGLLNNLLPGLLGKSDGPKSRLVDVNLNGVLGKNLKVNADLPKLRGGSKLLKADVTATDNKQEDNVLDNRQSDNSRKNDNMESREDENGSWENEENSWESWESQEGDEQSWESDEGSLDSDESESREYQESRQNSDRYRQKPSGSSKVKTGKNRAGVTSKHREPNPPVVVASNCKPSEPSGTKVPIVKPTLPPSTPKTTISIKRGCQKEFVVSFHLKVMAKVKDGNIEKIKVIPRY